eukprot:1723848-Pleurochrysis_carterae.AAC.3
MSQSAPDAAPSDHGGRNRTYSLRRCHVIQKVISDVHLRVHIHLRFATPNQLAATGNLDVMLNTNINVGGESTDLRARYSATTAELLLHHQPREMCP